MSEHPECDKMLAVHEKSQAIGEFLDWLRDTKGVHLMVWEDDPDFGAVVECDRWVPFRPGGTERLLADYFGIDLDRVEQEKRAILDEIRAFG